MTNLARRIVRGVYWCGQVAGVHLRKTEIAELQERVFVLELQQ